MFPYKKLPKSIKHCPITESVLEIRFSSKYPEEAVFGILYKELAGEFNGNKPTPLAILQIPEELRNKEESLRFKPHYQIVNDGFSLQIGPRVIALNHHAPYVGWDAFSKKFKHYVALVNKSDVFERITRLGLRYINVLENRNVLEVSDLKIGVGDFSLIRNNLSLTTIIENGKFKSRVKISNDIKTISPSGAKIGSVIDIDTYIEEDLTPTSLFEALDAGHKEEKGIFFGFLQQDFIDKELAPDYADASR